MQKYTCRPTVSESWCYSLERKTLFVRLLSDSPLSLPPYHTTFFLLDNSLLVHLQKHRIWLNMVPGREVRKLRKQSTWLPYLRETPSFFVKLTSLRPFLWNCSFTDTKRLGLNRQLSLAIERTQLTYCVRKKLLNKVECNKFITV